MNPAINNLYNKIKCPQCQNIFNNSHYGPHGTNCPNCNSNLILNTNNNYTGNNYTGTNNNYTGTNNVYYKDGCPAIMSDGRFITYYNSTNELTETMRKMNGFKNSNEFRNFMQRNGQLFMDSERNFVSKQNTCSPTVACSEGWYKLKTNYGNNWSTPNFNKQFY